MALQVCRTLDTFPEVQRGTCHPTPDYEKKQGSFKITRVSTELSQLVFENFWRDQANAQDHKSINTLDVLIPQ